MVQSLQGDLALVRASCAGDPAAGATLLRRLANVLWLTCRRLTRSEAEAREMLGEALAQISADSFLLLRGYDGRAPLETFSVLVCREVLAGRLLKLLDGDLNSAWSAFEAMFQADIHRLIKRRLPGMDREEVRREAYQEICLALIADDCRRLRAFRGRGAFGGFVLHMVDRLLIDYIRTFCGRRRVPTGRRQDPAAVAAPHAPRFVPLGEWSGAGDGLGADADPASPEEAMIAIEDGRLLAGAGQVLRDLARFLPHDERLYMQIALSSPTPRPAREIAKLMGRPVADVYRVREQLKRRLHDALQSHPAVREWRTAETSEQKIGRSV